MMRRTQQRRVEHVGPVRSGNQNDALVRLEAVHLDEQLVERLLALVVAAAEPGTAMPADRVDLVDENDAGRVLLPLLEQVAHARGAHADEHLDEVRAADREERHVRLAGHGARQKRLARAGRAHQQHTLRDAAAELLELLRLAQEVDNLLQFFLRFVGARDVLERDLLLRARRELRAALAERQRLVAAALHLPDHEDPEGDHQQDRRPRNQHRRPGAGRALFGRDDDPLLHQAVHQPLVRRRHVRGELLLGTVGGQRDVVSPDLVPDERDPLNLLLLDFREELREGNPGPAGLQGTGELPDQRQDDDQRHPEQETLQG
jgi:hypothetical protein